MANGPIRAHWPQSDTTEGPAYHICVDAKLITASEREGRRKGKVRMKGGGREMSGKVRREGEMRREKGWINQRLFVSLRAADVQREQEEAIGGVKGMRGEARTIRKTE